MYLLALLVYACDRIIKWVVSSHLAIGQAVPVVPHVIGLLYIRNPGAAWSILANDRWILSAIDVVVAVVLIYAKQKYKPGRLVSIGMGLVLAGALGNGTDRVIAGTVIDYLQFLFINFPIFNLADISIDAGIILLLWSGFRSQGDETKSGTDDSAV